MILSTNIQVILHTCRSLLLEKSNEIIRLKQDNDKYKQRVEKYSQEIKDKDKEIAGIFAYELSLFVVSIAYECFKLMAISYSICF